MVGGISHQLIKGYRNIYVQLADEGGTIIMQKLLLSMDGTATGDFTL